MCVCVTQSNQQGMPSTTRVWRLTGTNLMGVVLAVDLDVTSVNGVVRD